MYSLMSNNLRYKLTYSAFKENYCDSLTESEPESESESESSNTQEIVNDKKFAKYDIYSEIKNMSMDASIEHIKRRINLIHIITEKSNNGQKLENEEMRIYMKYKSGKDNISLHSDNLIFYNYVKDSFKNQTCLENKMIDGTYDTMECFDFLVYMINRSVPYKRVLHFYLILLINNKQRIKTNTLVENIIKKQLLNVRSIQKIRKGIINMYGFFEILTLDNIDKIIANLDEWYSELVNLDIIKLIISWKYQHQDQVQDQDQDQDQKQYQNLNKLEHKTLSTIKKKLPFKNNKILAEIYPILN